MKLSYRQALEASNSLMQLDKLELPIETGIQIARLSNMIDVELKIFTKERDKLVKSYKIKSEHADKEDFLSLSTAIEAEDGEDTRALKEETLREFVDKFEELLNQETPDYNITIPLPKDKGLTIKSKFLKAIEGFVEVV